MHNIIPMYVCVCVYTVYNLNTIDSHFYILLTL